MGMCLAIPVKSLLNPFISRQSNPGQQTSSSVMTTTATSSSTTAASSSRFTSTTTDLNISSSSGSTTDGPQPSSVGSTYSKEESPPNGRILPSPNLRVFSFPELKAATRNFRADTVLGEGGFGRVYKGWVVPGSLSPAKVGCGMAVAVKKLNPGSLQGRQEWQAEVNFLGRLSHPNLVKLLGYCWDDDELLLVYEFMAKGSLENHLFRRVTNGEPLPWDLRLKIAVDAARGLAFLHSSDSKIIYRDFKASNILLDSNYNAKISDFGLAKTGPAVGDSHVTTRVMGTSGYAAPEYVATGHLYVKSDVYGFGVVLLELLTGLRALDASRPGDQQNLVEWAKPLLSQRRKLPRLMDSRLQGRYRASVAAEAAQLALRCLAINPRSRPSMADVLKALEQLESAAARSPISVLPRSRTSTLPPNRPGRFRAYSVR